MITPTEAEFEKIEDTGMLIPVEKEIPADLETPVTAFLKLKSRGASFLLESVESGENIGRYSFIGLFPSLVINLEEGKVKTIRGSEIEEIETKAVDFLKLLKDILSHYPVQNRSDLPRLLGGAVGYIGYDMVRAFESLPYRNKNSLLPACAAASAGRSLPISIFILVETLVVFDHVKRKIKLLTLAKIEDNKKIHIGQHCIELRKLKKHSPVDSQLE